MAVTLDHSIHACLLSRAHRASLARVTKALSAPGAGLFMMCLLDAQVVDHCATMEKPLYREKQPPTVCSQFCNIYFYYFLQFLSPTPCL